MNNDINKLIAAVRQNNEEEKSVWLQKTLRKILFLSMEATSNNCDFGIVQSFNSQIEFLWKQLTLDEQETMYFSLSPEENQYFKDVLSALAPTHASLELLSTVKNTESRIQSVEDAVFSLVQKVQDLEKKTAGKSNEAAPQILKD